jgi:hypothetical protein
MLARQVQFNYEPIAGAIRVDGIYVSVDVWTMLNCAKPQQRVHGRLFVYL